MGVEDFLPPIPGPGQYDGGPRITHDPLSQEWVADLAVESDAPALEDAEQHTARVRAAGCPVPEGYVVELVEARHDPAAWTRAAQGEDAVTRPVWRCKYRVMRKPTALAAEVARYFTERPAAPLVRDNVDDLDSFHYGSSDEQAGEIDAGGVRALLGRWEAALSRVCERYERVGSRLPLHRWIGGDCVTGTASQGGGVIGRSEALLTEQLVIATDMQVRAIDALLSAGAPVVTSYVVPSNHGILSKVGNMVNTPLTSSWDLTVARQAAMVFRKDERVRWVLPEFDQQDVTVNVGELIWTLIHGHQVNKSTEAWWDAQAGKRHRPGTADILVRGHDHTGRIYDAGGERTIIHLPPLCGPSSWWTSSRGGANRARMMSWVAAGRRLLDVDGVN